MIYFRLLDPKHENIIVRSEGAIRHQFIHGRGWVRSGIMYDYFSSASPVFDEYEEITEEEALKAIES